MKTKTKIFRGLTFDIMVDEAEAMDASGGRLWYLAAIYIREHGQQQRHLVRKSRLPGAAEELAAAIRRDGLRAFDRMKTSA